MRWLFLFSITIRQIHTPSHIHFPFSTHTSPQPSFQTPVDITLYYHKWFSLQLQWILVAAAISFPHQCILNNVLVVLFFQSLCPFVCMMLPNCILPLLCVSFIGRSRRPGTAGMWFSIACTFFSFFLCVLINLCYVWNIKRMKCFRCMVFFVDSAYLSFPSTTKLH